MSKPLDTPVETIDAANEASKQQKLDRIRQPVTCRIKGTRKTLHFRSIASAFKLLGMPPEMVSPMQRVRIIVKHEGIPAELEFDGKTYVFSAE